MTLGPGWTPEYQNKSIISALIYVDPDFHNNLVFLTIIIRHFVGMGQSQVLIYSIHVYCM